MSDTVEEIDDGIDHGWVLAEKHKPEVEKLSTDDLVSYIHYLGADELPRFSEMLESFLDYHHGCWDGGSQEQYDLLTQIRRCNRRLLQTFADDSHQIAHLRGEVERAHRAVEAAASVAERLHNVERGDLTERVKDACRALERLAGEVG